MPGNIWNIKKPKKIECKAVSYGINSKIQHKQYKKNNMKEKTKLMWQLGTAEDHHVSGSMKTGTSSPGWQLPRTAKTH